MKVSTAAQIRIDRQDIRVFIGQVSEGIAHLISHLLGGVTFWHGKLCRGPNLYVCLSTIWSGLPFKGGIMLIASPRDLGNSSDMPSLRPAHCQSSINHCWAVSLLRGALVCQLGLYRQMPIDHPVCLPTRASIMTGKYLARLHLTDFIAGGRFPYERLKQPDWQKYLPLEETTIAEVLKNTGYATASFGEWHLSIAKKPPESLPFDPDK